jgi:uncharacterized membrane protein
MEVESSSSSAEIVRRSRGYKVAVAGLLVLMAAVLSMLCVLIAVLITGEHNLLWLPIGLAAIGVLLGWIGVIGTLITGTRAHIQMTDPSYVRAMKRHVDHDIRYALHLGRR